MGGILSHWAQADLVLRGVAVLLLAMSVSSWVVILWKGRQLARARRDVLRGIERWWLSSDLAVGHARVAEVDREGVLLPLLDAADRTAPPGTLASTGDRHARLTRHLRDALHEAVARLGQGQVVLASVGSTAPFVGLFGTVWGIYHALVAVSTEGAMSLERVSGPVGEALVMTAAGLAVAIPAVLAYNFFGQRIGECESALEGFAHDLRAWRTGPGA